MKPYPNHLYVATDGKLFKIGISANPPKRIKGLGSATRLIKAWRRPYAAEIEALIKAIFREFRAQGNEWFAITEKQMLAEVYRALRIEDDDQAMKRGRKPSKRGGHLRCPPFKLSWLKIKPIT